jgi:hypothetical protein
VSDADAEDIGLNSVFDNPNSAIALLRNSWITGEIILASGGMR